MSLLLIIIQVFLAVLALLKDELIKSPTIKKVFIVTILSLIFASSIFQIKLQLAENFNNQFNGVLTSPIQSHEENPILALGESKLVWSGNKNEQMFNFPDGNGIKMSMINGGVNFTTMIRDAEGNVIGEIVNNKWRIYSPYRILDRNFNSNTLEVKDVKGDIIFQVELYGNEVRLAGHFYLKEGEGPITFGPWLHELEHRSDSLFKYPSMDFPHKLNTVISENQ